MKISFTRKKQSRPIEAPKKNTFVAVKPIKESFLSTLLNDVFIKPEMWEAFTNVNILMIYFCILTLIAGGPFSNSHLILYGAMILLVRSWRTTAREKERQMNAHRLPFFADALANSLSVGSTLEQAFRQSVYYLRGRLKVEFERMMSKNVFGKDLGVLLWDLDKRFPRTGLRYLISLLEQYRDLGIGISPLLKRLAEVLKDKEEAEEKIRTILAGGSSYARMSIFIFGGTFIMFSFLLKEQFATLLSPSLKPILMFLVGWACIGMLIVTRITTLEYASHSALKPLIKEFVGKMQWSTPNLLSYSGLHRSLERWVRTVLYLPLLFGLGVAYVASWQSGNFLIILIAFLLGVMFSRLAIEFYLKGLVEDQLVETIEIFPEFLQVYIIGLNAGLNQFMAFGFALRAIEGMAPELLRRELLRAKNSLACGEDHSRAWRRLAERLPFETVIDFCEIMIISPLHGESIILSVEQMMNSYQAKKLALVEKKANAVGQYVIPVIVIAFFPLFLFVVFGPLFLQLTKMFT